MGCGNRRKSAKSTRPRQKHSCQCTFRPPDFFCRPPGRIWYFAAAHRKRHREGWQSWRCTTTTSVPSGSARRAARSTVSGEVEGIKARRDPVDEARRTSRRSVSFTPYLQRSEGKTQAASSASGPDRIYVLVGPPAHHGTDIRVLDDDGRAGPKG